VEFLTDFYIQIIRLSLTMDSFIGNSVDRLLCSRRQVAWNSVTLSGSITLKVM
jgi:hypothetical protein